MKRDEIDALVGSELEYIPKWPGEHQADLRMQYNAWRRSSLGPNGGDLKTPADVMRFCLKGLRERHPAAEVRFDAEFFGLEAAA